jgi:hypothetical protein
MRLIHVQTLNLVEKFGDQIPPYAILSHTWHDGEEVTYQDWSDTRVRSSIKGFQKITAACRIAQQDKLSYLWVDTICINKDSSSELAEAINSMFAWYKDAAICYAYIDDFQYKSETSLKHLRTARWFTRGWCLQELLAPDRVVFFDSLWTEFGTKHSLVSTITGITTIQSEYLIDSNTTYRASIARRMSWAAKRSTTREEDMAYCLLGLFEINMPLLYGEGPKAFIRLQEEIIKHNNDHTIFCWSFDALAKDGVFPQWAGFLAPYPKAFCDAGTIIETTIACGGDPSYQLTNSGLQITLPVLNALAGDLKLAVLNAQHEDQLQSRQCICLHNTYDHEKLYRSTFANGLMSIPDNWAVGFVSVCIIHQRDPRKLPTMHDIGTAMRTPSIMATARHNFSLMFLVPRLNSEMHVLRNGVSDTVSTFR